MNRLVEDYQSARGYARYVGDVMEQVPDCALTTQTSHTYCSHLQDLHTSVNLMKSSLANLVRPSAAPTNTHTQLTTSFVTNVHALPIASSASNIGSY